MTAQGVPGPISGILTPRSSQQLPVAGSSPKAAPGKENAEGQPQQPLQQHDSALKSGAHPEPVVPLSHLSKHLTCGICSHMLASSLVMSCGHIFCGSCLFGYLNTKPSCPTCQVNLRAIPVRCLALDSVVGSVEGCLDRAEAEDWKRRAEEGKSAANNLNKMFWWLQPAAVPVAGGNCDAAAGTNTVMGAAGMFAQQQQGQTFRHHPSHPNNGNKPTGRHSMNGGMYGGLPSSGGYAPPPRAPHGRSRPSYSMGGALPSSAPGSMTAASAAAIHAAVAAVNQVSNGGYNHLDSFGQQPYAQPPVPPMPQHFPAEQLLELAYRQNQQSMPPQQQLQNLIHQLYLQ